MGLFFSQKAIEVIKRKASDQSVTSSTTLVDETDLQVPVGVSETWMFEWILRLTFGATGQFKCKVVGPTNYTWEGTAVNVSNALVPAYAAMPEAGTVSLIIATATNGVATVCGTLTTDANNAGAAKLQFAQDTSDGTATVIKAKASYVRARKVA